ncbi:MAG: BON domain-containing protein [Paludibacteraceae bacterium]
MKKLSLLSMLALTFLLVAGVTSCKPNDAAIQKAVQTAIATNPDVAGVTATVDKGVVTLTGEVKDETTSVTLNALAAGVKDVKSVVNNLTVLPQVPIITAADQALIDGLTTALKDNPGVTSTVKDGVITLTGEVKKADLPKILQKVSALKPVKIDNQLTVK